MPARLSILIIGAWLFASVFLWPHSPAQATNDWICGLLTIGFGAIALAMPSGRYLCALLGFWIFLSSWVIPNLTAGTVWNNVLCGIAIVFLSLIPVPERAPREHRLYAYRRRREVHA